MLDPTRLGLFLGACLVLLVIPGPAVLYIVMRGVDQGRTAALVSVAGIHLGTVAHVLAAVVGLSAILAASATAFTAVKLAGAAYLVWLGVQRLRADDVVAIEALRRPPVSLRRIFWQGTVVNVLNPKTAVFFLAFLPQFVDAERGAASAQLLLLGLVFLLLGLATDGVYAVASGSLGRVMHRHRGAPRLSRILTGSTYIALGVSTATIGPARQ